MPGKCHICEHDAAKNGSPRICIRWCAPTDDASMRRRLQRRSYWNVEGGELIKAVSEKVSTTYEMQAYNALQFMGIGRLI